MRLGSSLVCKSSVKSNITERNGYHKRTGLFTILLKLLLSIFSTIPLVSTHRQSTWKSRVFSMVEVCVGQMIYFGVFGHFCCRNFELDEDFSIELSFGKKYCSLYHDKACVSSDTFTVLSFYLALFFTSRYLYALYPIDTRLQTSLHLTAFVLVHCKYSTRLWLLT